MSDPRVSATADERSHQLIETLGKTDFFNTIILTKIHDFFFELTQSEFDRLSRQMGAAVVSKLSRLPSYVSLNPNCDQYQIKIYRQELFSLLFFLGYKVQYSFSTADHIVNVLCAIPTYDEYELVILLNILKNSFEFRDQDFERMIPKIMPAFFPYYNKKFNQVLSSINDLKPQTYNLLLMLINILPNCIVPQEFRASIVPQFTILIQTLDKKLSEIQETESYADSVSHMSITMKAARLLTSPYVQKVVKDFSPLNTIHNVIGVLKRTPPTMTLIIEDAFQTINGYLNSEPEEIPNRLDIISPLYTYIFNFSSIRSDSVSQFLSFVRSLSELSQRNPRRPNQLVDNICKFTINVLHLDYLDFYTRNNRFISINFVKFPKDSRVRDILFELFFMSFTELLIEVDASTDNFQEGPQPKSSAEVHEKFNQLYICIECTNRVIHYFDAFLHTNLSNDPNKGNPFKIFFDPGLSSKGSKLAINLFKQIFIRLIKNRHTLQICNDFIKKFEPSTDFDENTESLASHHRSILLYERIRQYHVGCTKQTLYLLQHTSSVITYSAWALFLEEFFTMPEIYQLDTCLFRAVSSDTRVLSNFLSALTSFFECLTSTGKNLGRALSSFKILFEKIISQLTVTAKDNDSLNSIVSNARRIAFLANLSISSPMYCGEALGLIMALSKFIDHVCGQDQFSRSIFTEKMVSQVCGVYLVNRKSATMICALAEFAIPKLSGNFQPGPFVQILTKAAQFVPKPALTIIKALLKKGRIASVNQAILADLAKFLFQNLNTAVDGSKKLMVKIIHLLPSYLIANNPSDPIDVDDLKTITFTDEKEYVHVPLEDIIKATTGAVTLNPNDESLKQFLADLLVHTFEMEDWNISFRIFIQKELEDIYKALHGNADFFVALSSKLTSNVPQSVAHLICSYMACNVDVSENLAIATFGALKTQQDATYFMKEVSLIATSNVLPFKVTLEGICELIKKYIDEDCLDPIVYSQLVINIVIMCQLPTWKDSQKVNGIMNFIELDLIPINLQNVVAFARKLVEKAESIAPLLEDCSSASSFLGNLLISEIVSSRKCDNEVLSYIDNYLKSGVDDMNMFRIIGTLLRAFPDAYLKFKDVIDEIVTSRIKTITSKENPYQANFLVMLIPVITSKEAPTLDISIILPLILSFLKNPTSYKKCQAQIILKKLWTSSDQRTRTEIIKAQALFFKENSFPSHQITEFVNVNWKLLLGNLFSFFYINPSPFIENMSDYLRFLPDAISTSSLVFNGQDVLNNVMALFEVISTGFFRKSLAATPYTKRFIKAVLKSLKNIPTLPQKKIMPLFATFVAEFSKPFLEVVTESLESDPQFDVLAELAKQPSTAEIINQYVLAKEPQLKNLLSVPGKINRKMSAIFSFLCETPATAQIPSLTEGMFEYHKVSFENFTKNFENLDILVFRQTTEFIAKYFPERFILLTYVFEYNEPFLTAIYFTQFNKYFHFESLDEDYMSKLPVSDNVQYSFRYLSAITRAVLLKRKDLIQPTIEYIVNNYQLDLVLMLLNFYCERNIEFDFSMFNILQIYEACEKDAEKIDALYLWGFTKSADHFIILFRHLCGFLHFYPDSRIRHVINSLRIPEGVDVQIIAGIITEAFRMYARCHPTISVLFSFIAKNKEAFGNATSLFYTPIQDHLIFFEGIRKKQSQLPMVTILADIVSIINLDGLTEPQINALNIHLNSAGLTFLSLITETTEIFNKYGKILIQTIAKITQLFPTTPTAPKIFEYMQSLSDKQKTQQQPQSTDVRALDILNENISEIIDGVVQNTEFKLLDSATDSFIEAIQHQGMTKWPNALGAISRILQNDRWKDKTMDRIKPLFYSEHLPKTFPLYWKFTNSPFFRTSTLAENGINIIKNIGNDQVSFAFSGPNYEEIAVLLFDSQNPQILTAILGIVMQASIPKWTPIAAFFVEIALRPLFDDPKYRFRTRLIQELKNPILARATFSRSFPRDCIIELLPTSALMTLVSIPGAPELAYELISKKSFNEILIGHVDNKSSNVPFVFLLSKFTSMNLIKLAPFLNGQTLPRNVLKVYNNSENFSMHFSRMFDAMRESEANNKFDSRSLESFPDFNSIEEEVHPSILYYRMGMLERAIQCVDRKADLYESRWMVQQVEVGDGSLIDVMAADCLIEKKLTQIFDYLERRADNVCSESIGEYMVIREVKRVAAALKKHSEGFQAFSYTLPATASPYLHQFYKEVRDATRNCFTVANGPKIDERHMRQMALSKYYHNSTAYTKPTEDPSELAKDVSANLGKIIISLLATPELSEDLKVAIETTAIALHSKDPNADEVLMTVERFRVKLPKLLNKVARGDRRMPFEWSLTFGRLIQKHSELAPMRRLLHPAAIIPDSFRKVVEKFTKCDAITKQKEGYFEIQKAIEENRTASPELPSMGSIGSAIIEVAPPLSQAAGRSQSITFYVGDPASFATRMFLTMNTGELVHYVITPAKLQSQKLAHLSVQLSKLLKLSPGTHMRGMSVPHVQSIRIGDFYVSCTKARPLYDLRTFEPFENKAPAYHSKSEYCKWVNSAATKYAASTAVQLLTKSKMPSPLDIVIDSCGALFVSRFEKGEKVLPRLTGRVSSILDTSAVMGPFRFGIIAAADAIALHKQKIAALVGDPVDMSKYSLRETGQSEAIDEVNHLIKESLTAIDSFCVPWL